jgi:hypothetical protein
VRAVVLTTLLMAVVPMIGCSPTGKCESVCAQWNACTIDQRAVDFECSFLCNDVEAQQDRAAKEGQPDCKAEYEAHLDCWQSNSKQICNKEFTDCRATGTAWTTCMRTYCGYVGTAKLTDQNCANGNTTFVPFN